MVYIFNNSCWMYFIILFDVYMERVASDANCKCYSVDDVESYYVLCIRKTNFGHEYMKIG